MICVSSGERKYIMLYNYIFFKRKNILVGTNRKGSDTLPVLEKK